MPKVVQIQEDSIEAVVAVDKPEIEAPTFLQKPWKHNLGLLGVAFHEVADTRLLEDLQPAVAKPPRLTGIEHNMPGGRIAVQKQAFTDV